MHRGYNYNVEFYVIDFTAYICPTNEKSLYMQQDKQGDGSRIDEGKKSNSLQCGGIGNTERLRDRRYNKLEK